MSRGVGSRERVLVLNTDAIGAAPARNVAPHLTVSPRTAAGLMTASLGVILLPPTAGDGILYIPAALPAGGGFSLTIYRAIPTLGEWGALQTHTGIAYRDQLVLNDVSGAVGLYFRIGNVDTAGNLFLGIAEMG